MKVLSCRTTFRRRSRVLLPIVLGALAVAGLLFGAQPVSAQSAPPTCIQDVWKAHGNNQSLTCTAKDVTLSDANNINILSGGLCQNGVCKCFSGGNVTFTADFRMDLTADTRYDVGFYLATDGGGPDGALTGQCSATASYSGNTLNGTFINLDAQSQPGDLCGDTTGPLGTDHNPLLVRSTITTKCEAGPSGQLELPWCTTWRQPGANAVCRGTGNGTTTNDVYPGSPSKCNCGNLVVDILVETATITVTKTALSPATVPESGGSQTYTVTVKNDADVASVTLDSLTDDKYGDITNPHAAGGGFLEVTQTDCTLATIAAKDTYSCSFVGKVPPGDTGGTFADTVTACGTDSFGHTGLCDTDDAVVTYIDVQQAPTLSKTVTGAACQVDVTYTVVVTNTSAQDKLTLTSLVDDVYGSITSAHAAGQGVGQVVSTTCGQPPASGGAGALPFEIQPSDNYTCSFVGRITTCNTTVTDTVTGAATDDDGASYTPSDDATVTVTVGGLPTP